MDISSFIIKKNQEMDKSICQRDLLYLQNYIMLYIIKPQMDYSALKTYKEFGDYSIP